MLGGSFFFLLLTNLPLVRNPSASLTGGYTCLDHQMGIEGTKNIKDSASQT